MSEFEPFITDSRVFDYLSGTTLDTVLVEELKPGMLISGVVPMWIETFPIPMESGQYYFRYTISSITETDTELIFARIGRYQAAMNSGPIDGGTEILVIRNC